MNVYASYLLHIKKITQQFTPSTGWHHIVGLQQECTIQADKRKDKIQFTQYT